MGGATAVCRVSLLKPA